MELHAVVLPEADRADLEPTSLPKGEVPTAGAGLSISRHDPVFRTSWPPSPAHDFLPADSEVHSPANSRAILIGNDHVAEASHFRAELFVRLIRDLDHEKQAAVNRARMMPWRR